MRKFPILPSSADYSATPGTDVISTKLDGGMSRYRQDIIGAAAVVNVSWELNPDEYTYFEKFYRVTKGQPFLIDLVLDSSELVERTCYFIPGSKSLTAQSGYNHSVSAQLEVKPIQFDDLLDEAEIDMLAIYGSYEEASLVFASLEQLVNYDLDVT